MKQKAFPAIIAAVGILTLLYQFVFFVQQTGKIMLWKDSGSLGVSFEGDPELGPWLVDNIEDPVPVGGPSLALGDTMTALVTTAGDSLSLAEYDDSVFQPGDRITILFVSATEPGPTRLAEFEFRRHGNSGIAFSMSLMTLRFLISIGFLAVGLRALAKRPDLPGVWLLALFSFSVVALMIAGVNMGLDRFEFFEIPGDRIFQNYQAVMFMCMGGFWLNLQLLFPRPAKWGARRFWLIHVALYLPQVFLLAGFADLFVLPAASLFGVYFLQVGLGFAVLFIRRAKAQDSLERRQLTLVCWGSVIGLGLLFLVMIIAIVPVLNRLTPNAVVETLIMASFLGLLALPASFAFAFGSYGLLDMQGKLHRGTRYLLVTGLLLLGFFTVIYFASGLLLSGLNITGRSPILAVALVLTLGFTPIHRRAQISFENRIYPERRRLREILGEFLASTTTLPDRDGLWQQLEVSLQAGLGIHAILPCIQEAESENFVLPDGSISPLSAEEDLVSHLQFNNKPLLVDEINAGGKITLTPAGQDWLQEHNIVVLLPLTLRSNFLGFIGLVGGEGWQGLSVAGLEELSALGAQVALECESLRLLEVTLANRRMEQELDMARQMQEGLLPSSLPDTPGLDMAACLQSSLEVAGDYYDVLALPDGQTMVAVGDVSGKGAGAAMIMANLQASIRSLVRVGVPLQEMVDGINDILYTNTPVDKFVTFFVGIYDPKQSKLSYVNAGHNPPRIIHENGTSTELPAGGPMLGAFPGIVFKMDTIEFQPSELLVAFTDGVSEAMNAEDEDFGEARIVETIAAHPGQSPNRLLELVEEAVDEFRGAVPLGDDYTIMIATVNCG